MDPLQHELAGLLLIVGGLVLAAEAVRLVMARLSAPDLVGYILLGLALRLGQDRLDLVPLEGEAVLEFLAGVGIVALLFRIGLDSDIHGILGQLRGAALVWVSNMVLTAVPAWAVAHYLLGLPLLASLAVAVALTATSVGVSMGVWRENGAIATPQGALLLDAAELDDISGVALMALLFAVAPALAQGAEAAVANLWPIVGAATLDFTWKFVAFVIGCALLALVMDRLFQRLRLLLDKVSITVLAVATALVVAAAADWLGFSLAVGALFAGLAFSGGEPRLMENHALQTFHDLFAPFFFIGIGYAVDPAALGPGLALGAGLLVLAVATKLGSTALPAWFLVGPRGAVLLGLSMVPRAEIAMIVTQYALTAGYLSPTVHAAMVVVTLASCVLAPWLLHILLGRWRIGGKGLSRPA